MSEYLYYRPEDLKEYIVRFLTTYKVPLQQARTTAEILTAADLRGIHTHGITQLLSLIHI